MTPDDSDLLRRFARGGDERAFAELVRRYLGLVHSAAIRQAFGRPDIAADVAQQVFTTLARKARALEHHAALAGWLHTTTRNMTRDTLRAERRRRAHELEAATMETLNRSESNAEWGEVRAVIDAAIGELSVGDREMVLLRFFAALSLAEIGRRLGVNENTARMRVNRAVERLRARLRRHGVTSTAAALSVTLTTPSFAAPALPVGLAATVTSSALASAGSAAATFGAIGFMSTAKWVGGMAAAFVMLGIVSIVSHQRRVDAEHELVAAQQDHERLRVDAVRAERGAVSAEERLATAKQEHARPAKAGAGQKGRAADRPPSSSAGAITRERLAAEGHAFLDRHPEVKAALSEYVRANLRFQYGPIYRELGLTTEQIEQFENLRGEGTGMGASTADGGSMTLMFGRGKRPDDYGVRMEGAIGPHNASRMAAWSATAAARHIVAEVAGDLYFTDAPLVLSQADHLVGLVAAARLPNSREVDWPRLMAQAGGVLSAPQLKVLAGRRAGDDFKRFLNRPRAEAARMPQ